LKIFLKIVQSKSVTKASEELNLTQPAVSIQLRNFQDQFDIPLTEVVGRKIYITDFGLEIAEAAENIINQVHAINYKTLAYNQIRTITRERAVGSTTIIDATTGKTFDTTKTPIAIKADDKKVTAIVDTSKDKSVSDRWARAQENNNPIPDLIKFSIGGVTFFAYLTSLSMADSFGTDEKKELLAPYGQFLYSDHSRSVDVSFMVVADSADQLERQWSKLKLLQLQSGPVNISSGMIRPRTSSLTIGDIYSSLPVILESISFSIDNESPWEITDRYQRPMYISVDVSCRVVPSSKTSRPTVG
jgi:hypothetical protein